MYDVCWDRCKRQGCLTVCQSVHTYDLCWQRCQTRHMYDACRERHKKYVLQYVMMNVGSDVSDSLACYSMSKEPIAHELVASCFPQPLVLHHALLGPVIYIIDHRSSWMYTIHGILYIV